MTLFREIAAVTFMNLRSLPQRASASLVIVVGIAGVVAVLVSVLAMSTGMIETIEHAGRADRAIVMRNGSASEVGSALSREAARADRAIVMRNGSASEVGSALSREAARAVGDAPGVKRDGDGRPIVSAEVVRLLSLYKKVDGAEVNVGLRGVGPQGRALRPEIRIIAGRMFAPAVTEMIVGKAAQAQFKGLEIGDSVRTRGATWTIVGVFASGDVHESALMTDAETLIASEQRRGFQSATVLLESPAAFQRFKDALTANPALAVDVSREPEYYRQQSQTLSKVISVLAYLVGGIMAVGAVFSALNTMYSAVSARVREIATLRALGFGATAMVASVLAEALLLALIGGVLGAALAWIIFNGYTVTTSGGAVTGQLVFDLSVSPALVALGVAWACIIGLIGGLFPAVRAAWLPVATALRAV